VPDKSHVGRRYTAPGQRIAPESARAVAQAIAGEAAVREPDAVPPTFAAVYCLGPTLAKLFGDSEVGMDLAGLIHGEQSFEWPEPVRPGDVVDATAEITSVETRGGMTIVRLAMEAIRPADKAVVCRGTSLMIIRASA